MDLKVYRNIKKIRELKNFTREYVSGELGMSTSGYGKIERGEVDLTVTKIIRLAAILEVSVSFIFNFNINDIFEETKKSKSHK
jgi:transcriptional regulator with XRE-family HTH domain